MPSHPARASGIRFCCPNRSNGRTFCLADCSPGVCNFNLGGRHFKLQAAKCHLHPTGIVQEKLQLERVSHQDSPFCFKLLPRRKEETFHGHLAQSLCEGGGAADDCARSSRQRVCLLGRAVECRERPPCFVYAARQYTHLGVSITIPPLAHHVAAIQVGGGRSERNQQEELKKQVK